MHRGKITQTKVLSRPPNPKCHCLPTPPYSKPWLTVPIVTPLTVYIVGSWKEEQRKIRQIFDCGSY